MAIEDLFRPGEPLQSFLVPEIRRATERHRAELATPDGWARVEDAAVGDRRINVYELAAMRLWLETPDGQAEYGEFAFDVDALLKRLGKNPNPGDACLEDGRIVFGSLG